MDWKSAVSHRFTEGSVKELKLTTTKVEFYEMISVVSTDK